MWKKAGIPTKWKQQGYALVGLPPSHIYLMKIMLEAVVSQALNPSSGPKILLFKRFKAAWPEIDQTKFNHAPSSAQDNAYMLWWLLLKTN